MTDKTIVIDNKSSFREIFNNILLNHNIEKSKIINGITYNCYDYSKNDINELYELVKKILKEIPYKKSCLTFTISPNGELKIECNPYLGSA